MSSYDVRSMNLFAIKDNPKHPLYWTYHRLRNYQPVWYYALNREARSFWQRKRSPLDEYQKRVVQDIEKDGIAFAPISDFFGGSVFADLEEFAQELFNQPEIKEKTNSRRLAILNRASSNIHKDFFLYALGGGIQDRPILDLENPLLKFVLDEKIIAMAAAYLKLAPRFNSFALLRTLTVPPDYERTYSQRWHRDLDDKKMLKVFIYLNDVDEGGGPFTYVKESHLGGRWRGVAPQLPPMGRYPKEGEVEAAIPKEYYHAALGKAGTLIFADTSGLHRGGFCLKKDRLHFVGSYTSWASVLPVSFTLKPNFDKQKLSPLGQYALS